MRRNMKIKVAAAQLNPTVGDLDGNFLKIKNTYDDARDAKVDLVVTPEMSLAGYPLEDLVEDEFLLEEVQQKLDELTQYVGSQDGPSLIVGYPCKVGSGVCNAARLIYSKSDHPGKPNSAISLHGPLENEVFKYELPNFGVFDEYRNFAPASEHDLRPLDWRGLKLGLMICEDAWHNTVPYLTGKGADLVVVVNGSPYDTTKMLKRGEVLRKVVEITGAPVVYVNMVGGQDELVFDGNSMAYDGINFQKADAFVEGLFYFDITFPVKKVDGGRIPKFLASVDSEIYQALVLGTRDYLRKQGMSKVVLGYSGGVDSGLVAAIACDAVGPENVDLVSMPSAFSSEGSKTDAMEGARRLGANFRIIPIESVVNELRFVYKNAIHYTLGLDGSNVELDKGEILVGVADENIQARVRGTILMAISNQESKLLLSTGNKSEVAMGYSTLYGDMNGGFNPIKDVYKTQVWKLCYWRNKLTEGDVAEFGFLGKGDTIVVPEEIITKAPSAELRPNQKDQDSLPPYEVLDDILHMYVEDGRSVDAIIARYGVDMAKRVVRAVGRAEFKRRQACPGIKITAKNFSRDRRYPIVNKWDPFRE